MSNHGVEPDGDASIAIVGCPMAYVCHKRWDELTPTTKPRVRYCGECRKRVTLCVDQETLDSLAARGQCVAFWGRGAERGRHTLGLPANFTGKLGRLLDNL